MDVKTAIIGKHESIPEKGWRCGFCDNINTVDKFTIDSIKEGKTILSTCKFCEDTFNLKLN